MAKAHWTKTSPGLGNAAERHPGGRVPSAAQRTHRRRFRAALMVTTALAAMPLATPAGAQAVWTGAISSDWTAPGNWSVDFPNDNVDVTIDTLIPNPAQLNGPGEADRMYVGRDGTGALTIDAGSLLLSGEGSIGFSPGSNGTVTVSGAAASWKNSADLYVGVRGAGALTIENGGTVSNEDGVIGWFPGSSGTVTVSGTDALWQNSGLYFHVGFGSGTTGELIIKDGGTVSTNSGSIATNSGSLGTVTVSGTDASWQNSGSLRVGENGNGLLTIEAGGTVINSSGAIGGASGSNGAVNVSGAGASWQNSQFLLVGVSGTGSLTVDAGATVSNTSGWIGRYSSSNGTVGVSGAGASWQNSADLFVGGNGAGALTIATGGTVSNTDGYIGFASGSIGIATVSGAGASWQNSGDLFVGGLGTGALTIADGGMVSSTNAQIGGGFGSDGTVTIAGVGTSWENSGELYVGAVGTGTLVISNGGVVKDTKAFVGREVDSTGTVVLSGAGSSWEQTNVLRLGYLGTGSITVSDSAALIVGSNTILGQESTGIGALEVIGTGSTWSNNFFAIIGQEGTGSLTIADGGTVTNGLGAYLGAFADATGTVTVDGQNSTWTIGQELEIGNQGTGSLTIGNGGTVTVSTDAVLGNYDADGTGDGTVIVTGQDSLLSIGGNLRVGREGTGEVTIAHGGAVSNTFGSIGDASGSSGTVLVMGADASWQNSADLMVGRNGAGALTIEDGGTVSNQTGIIGYNSGSSGTVTVSGAYASWQNSGFFFYVGYDSNSTGSLIIKDGGTVSSNHSYIGTLSGSTGAVTVSGSDALWQISGSLDVGRIGTGSLNIDDGGTVFNTQGSIGTYSGSWGEVTVSGPGALWQNSAALLIGHAGTGTLTVADGGVVSASTMEIAPNDTSTGTLNIGAAAGDSAAAAGTLDTDTVAFGAGVGEMVFNHTATNYLFNPALSGVGSVSYFAGTTVLTGDSAAFAGTTTVHAGTLVIDGTLGGTIAVTTGGRLSGSGTVGTTTVADGGTIAPGNSVGTLTVAGGLSLSAGSLLDYELGSPGAAGDPASGASDRIDVTGNLTLDGTLNLAQSDDAGDGAAGFGYYRLLTYGGALTDTGLEIGATSALADPALYQIQTGGNRVDLFIVAVGDDTLQHWQGGDGVWNATNEQWLNQGGDVEVAWAGNHAVFKNEPGGFDGGTLTVEGTQSFKGLQFVDEGYRLEGGGLLEIDGSDSAEGNAEIRVLAERAEIATAIIGTGGLTKTQAGTLVLSGTSSYSGGTSVAAGILVVNGSIAGSAVAVEDGARLGGTGTVGDTTIASGATIAPGNSLGPLNVAGDITFDAGSTYEVEVDPAGSDSDLIAASGTATLNGGSVVHIGADGSYDPTSTYTILTAEGGVTGTFDDITSNFAFLDPILGYGANDVRLTLERNDIGFGEFGATPNHTATAGGIETLTFGHALYDAAVQLGDDSVAIRATFDALSGEILASAKTALIEDSRFVREAAAARVRAAFGAVGSSTMPVMAYGPAEQALVREGKSARSAPGSVLAPADTDRFATWSHAFGARGKTDSDGNGASLERSTGGLLIGADALVGEWWRVGLLAGYSRSSFDVDHRASSGDSDNYHLGLYGGTQWGALGIRAGAAYTWHDIEIDRAVGFTGFADSPSASYDAATAQVFGEVGYRVDTAVASFEPFAGVAYVNLNTDGFTEDGGAAALSVDGATTDTTFTTLGVRVATDFTLGTMQATARGMLGWRHAFGDITPLSTHTFAGGDAFTVAGVPIAQDAAVIEAGLDFVITQKAILGISYNGQIASDARDHGLKADFTMKF